MNEKVDLIKVTGENIQADVICFFENSQSNKRYIYYTLNETVGSGPNETVKIYVGKVKQNAINLDTPITDADWDYLKGIMGEVLQGKINPDIKYLPISELNDKSLVSEMAIAMPLTYDYINKHKSVYSSNMTAVVMPVNNVTPEVAAPVQEVGSSSISTVQEEPIIPEAPASNIANNNDSVLLEPATKPGVSPMDSSTSVIEAKTNSDMKSINIDEIEAKYNEMIESLNRLKAQEIEAIKRYNATLELSSMHNVQHAEYVQNEQNREMVNTVSNASTVENISATTSVEPTPIVTTAPEIPQQSSIETNWFDMPTDGQQ